MRAGEWRASDGGEVIVKPPGLGSEGMCTSSHWPGRNWIYGGIVGRCTRFGKRKGELIRQYEQA
jgi:hypothetical protein